MIVLAVREADLVAVDSLSRKLPAEHSVAARLLVAMARRDSAAVSTLEAEAAALPDPDPSEPWTYLGNTAFAGVDYETAERFARTFTTEQRPTAMRGSAHGALGNFAALRGQWEQARREFARARRLGDPAVDYLEAALAARAFLPVPVEERLALHDRIMRLDSVRLPPFGNGRGRVLTEHVRLYTAGSLSVAAGDTVRALQYARRIDQLEPPELLKDAARSLAESVRAQVAWARRDAAATLRLLRGISYRVPLDVMLEPLAPWDQTYERYLRAEALLALGRYDEALRWYEGLADWITTRALFLAPSDLRQAEIYERIGETDKARVHFDRFIRLWHECDPPLRPQVTYAQQRLAALAPRS